MYVLECPTVYALTSVLFWCLFPELLGNGDNKHQNNTRVCALTIHHESTYILGLAYVLLMTSKSFADDVTIT